MYCPQCSENILNNLQFCSKCGFSVEEIRKIIVSGSALKVSSEPEETKSTARQKGLRQGVKLILLSGILYPLHLVVEGLLASVENTNLDDLPQFLVDALLLIILLAGISRIFYAFTFERESSKQIKESSINELNAASTQYALPASEGTPVSDFYYRRDTGKLVQTPSVTEHTTASLKDALK